MSKMLSGVSTFNLATKVFDFHTQITRLTGVFKKTSLFLLHAKRTPPAFCSPHCANPNLGARLASSFDAYDWDLAYRVGKRMGDGMIRVYAVENFGVVKKLTRYGRK